MIGWFGELIEHDMAANERVGDCRRGEGFRVENEACIGVWEAIALGRGVSFGFEI